MTIHYTDDTLTLLLGTAQDVLPTLESRSVDCVVTSPPYFGLRDYEGNPDQIGLEQTPAEYVARLVAVFDEARRVLADDGTLWLNLGDSYSQRVAIRPSSHQDGYHPDRPELRKNWKRDKARGLTRMPRQNVIESDGWYPPEKNLMFIPERVAIALQQHGWIVRNKIAWHKPNAMPESVLDRLSTRHEMLFMLTKSRRYWFDLDPIREPLAHPDALDKGIVDRPKNGGPGRNPGDVWSIPTTPFAGAHFATFPVELPRRCIAAGCKPGGTVLDPFSGAGTTALAAQQLGRKAVGIDINAAYHDIALRRMSDAPLPFGEAS